MLLYSLESPRHICCGYPLELPQQGDSNEYPHHMFLLRNKQNYPLMITKYPPYLFHCNIGLILLTHYSNDLQYLCRQVSANSVDPDQTVPYQIAPEACSGSTQFTIPSASFRYISVWLNHTEILGGGGGTGHSLYEGGMMLGQMGT